MARRTRRAPEPDEQDQVDGDPLAGREGETVYLQGEGGAISPRTLPLSEPERDLVAAGRLVEVTEVREVTDPDTGATRWEAGSKPTKSRGRKPAEKPDPELVALADAGLGGLSAEDIEALHFEAQHEAELQELADAGITEGTTAEDLQALAEAATAKSGGGKAKS